jgi:pilus assembly protein CpaB
MWKVKRMNTARIVVLTIAVGVGGTAASAADGSDHKPLPTETAAQPQTVDVSVVKSEAGLGRPSAEGRDDIIHTVRYRLSSSTTTQK